LSIVTANYNETRTECTRPDSYQVRRNGGLITAIGLVHNYSLWSSW